MQKKWTQQERTVALLHNTTESSSYRWQLRLVVRLQLADPLPLHVLSASACVYAMLNALRHGGSFNVSIRRRMRGMAPPTDRRYSRLGL